ncbi:exocyst complex component 3-like protein 4 [Brachyistius frenatus]|uniref:exocyst complex component 3-like protein 4 n=1 Tax=Brachyistius frenatus TaxID=100188 RepID=UPI0037E78410
MATNDVISGQLDVLRDEMSQMMDKSTDNTSEDRVSLKSNEQMSTNGIPKLGMLQSFRMSFRHAVEKSPLSPTGKGSKVTPKGDTSGNESGSSSSQPPPSPSLSSRSPATSPVESIEVFLQKKEEDEAHVKHKSLPRPKTDPNMSRFSNSFMTRAESFRRSLNLGTKKDRDKNIKQETLIEGLAEEQKEEEGKEEDVWVEMEESYTLPEIPHTPLSVMQINKLIETEVLEEAHLHLLALRQEFQREREQCAEDSPTELAKKEKDLSLLYTDLRNKIGVIVRDSNSHPSRNKALLVPVARIIQEEERRAEEPGGLPDSWREAWKEAVREGVQVKVESVHLQQREQDASWLAVHLGLLGKTILEDLENVKRELRSSYTPSFKVFSTYVRSYHEVVGQHLKKLEQQVTELKDLYALLDWIINKYKSESIMGSFSLQTDMQGESTDLQLEEDFLRQLKEKCCRRVKEDMRSSLDLVIELENEDIWMHSRVPEKEENFLHSPFPMDIWTKVKGNAMRFQKIDAQLEQSVISSCLEELKHFPKKFESEFRRHCSKLKPLWTEYQITYINSFTSLQDHIDNYQDSCPDGVEGFRQEVKLLVARLMQDLEDQFKDEVKPYLRSMMTRKWLTNNEDFDHLYRHTELLSKHCNTMRPPHVQGFVSRLHYHVVREYVSQLMKNNYTCKNRKHETAATKIRHQWDKLRELFVDMKSTHEWLHSVGDDLSDIIGQKNKTDIKNHLQPLMEHYPDFSRKHLVAVLYFRGLLRGSEHRLILQRLTALKKEKNAAGGDTSRVLFGNMQASVHTDCLSSLPFSCLSSLLPDN